MPAQYGYTEATATGRYSFAIDNNGPGDNVGSLGVGVGSSAWTVTATVQANPFTADQDPDGDGWQNIQVRKMSDGSFESTPTLTADTAASWEFDLQPFQQAAFNVTAISGTLPFNIQSFYRSGGLGVVQTQAVSQSISGTLTVTSSSANALAVGPNGATNPTLQIDGSTSSAATGLKVKSAAAGAGLALSTISSGTNENLTIDSKGSGTVTINATGTGNVVIGQNLAITDAKNVVLATTAGTSFGSATTQKLSFYGVTPITQPAASSAVSVTGTTGASTGVSLDTTFTGGGTAAFTIGGIVTRLKALGLLAA